MKKLLCVWLLLEAASPFSFSQSRPDGWDTGAFVREKYNGFQAIETCISLSKDLQGSETYGSGGEPNQRVPMFYIGLNQTSGNQRELIETGIGFEPWLGKFSPFLRHKIKSGKSYQQLPWKGLWSMESSQPSQFGFLPGDRACFKVSIQNQEIELEIDPARSCHWDEFQNTCTPLTQLGVDAQEKHRLSSKLHTQASQSIELRRVTSIATRRNGQIENSYRLQDLLGLNVGVEWTETRLFKKASASDAGAENPAPSTTEIWPSSGNHIQVSRSAGSTRIVMFK